MIATVVSLTISVLFAALIGFAAHRASICTVRAAAELISTRTAFMLASIAKSALWVMLLTLPLFLLAPPYALAGWPVTGAALLGGFVFGLGAAINGGCAYSTMSRLADGEGGMAVSVAGFALGILIFTTLLDFGWVSRPVPVASMLGAVLPFGWFIVAGLLLWAVYEFTRIWRDRPRDRTWRDLLLAPNYRLSAAALLIGVPGAIIFSLAGSPGYTITLQNAVENMFGQHDAPTATSVVLLLAVLAGMGLSTWQRGSFRLDWRPRWRWLQNLCGGTMMGFGTALLPGGNDALVLYAFPTFSPHALPAYIALVGGALIGLAGLHRAGVECRVVCRNDIYEAQCQPAGSVLNGHAPRE